MDSLWLKTILLYVFPLCAFASPIQVCTTCPYTTIRDALDAATPGDVIEVADPIHTESGIIVKKDITLQGAPGTIIQAAASTAESNDRVIFVQEGSLTLRGLTIRHGKQENGGALYAAPGTTVTIEDCVFTDNEAKNYGAIDNRGQMTINRSTLSGNYGSSTNGALGNQPSGNLTLVDTQITDNLSQWFNGGVANFGTMTLERCTLARNADAMGRNGALTSSNGSMILTNCTISNNTGWAVRLISGTMTMNHVTLAHNGKGIEVKSDLTVTGSIIAENGTDMVINGGSVATNGLPNLCGDGTCPGFTTGNADLLPLTLEKGNLIHPLGDSSAAVDAYPGPCPETDQRGQARPQGVGCDLGAVEFVPSNAPPEIITASLPQAAQFAPYQVTLEAMDPDGDALLFQLAEGPAGLALDAATGTLTWVPDNQAGSHPVSITVSDGVETVSRGWLLEVTQANRPPAFTSTPNTTHLLIPAVGDAQPLIYSGYGASWQGVAFEGYASGGSWSGPIAGDGTSITQSTNGDPSVWLSSDGLANGRFEGQIQVTAGSDDDYIGLVFGWQDARNFYLFDWKRGSQNEALVGMNLRRVRSNPRADTSPLPLWKTITDEPADGIANLYHNDIPWQRHTVYTVTIDFYPGEIIIEVREPAGTVAAFSVLDDSFTGGRFGFYNFSQEQTHYRGFTREITASRTWTYPLAATDADGDALTFSLLQAPAGVILGPDHALSWHTTTADQGEHPITVAVSDGQTVTEQSFILRVSFDHPVIQGTPDTTAAVGELYSFAPGAIDPTPGDVLTLSLDPAPPGMAVTAGLVTWTPLTTGTFPAGLHVIDAGGHVTSLHWEIEVSQPGNHRPRLTEALPAWAASGYPYLWRAEAVDADGDPLLFDLPLAPDGMAVNAVTGLVSWLPQGAGERRAEIRVTDPGGLWDLRATTITLTDNTPPVFTSTPGTNAQAHRDWAYRVAATDPDGDAVSFRLIRFPKGMRIEDDRVTWHPRPDDVGSHAVIVAADDGRATTWQSFEVTVSPFANGAITITTTPPTRIRNVETYRYVPMAVDAEDDPLTWYFATAPPGMTLDAQGITWQPDATGDVAVGLRVRDDYGGLAGQTYTISVVENALPEFRSTAPLTATVGQTYRYVAQADDADGDPITYSLLQGPVGLTIHALSGEVVWNPAGSQIGSHALSIQADDGLGGTARQDIVITVSGPPNAPPRFTSQPQTLIALGQSWQYTPMVIDDDGDNVTLSIEDAPAGLIFEGGVLVWNPTAPGTFPITIHATDGVETTRQAFALNVQAHTHTAPVFTSTPPLQAQAGVPYVYDAEIEDPDGYPIGFTLVSAPPGMALDRTRGIVSWTPSLAQLGSHPVTLEVEDGSGKAASQHWTITVTDPGDITPPELGLSISSTRVQPGEEVTLWLTVNEPADTALTMNGAPLPLDGQMRASFTSAVPGRFEAVALATDAAGNQTTDQVRFWVEDPTDTNPPVVAIHSPDDDSTLTAPTDIEVTVTDDNLSHWTIEAGKDGCFTIIAEGTASLNHSGAGRLDAGLMPNGLYDLRLTAWDVNGRGTTVVHKVAVEGHFKVGRFTQGFEDLSVRLRGIPATVNRLYDSFDACPGDFGVGWKLWDVEVQVSTTFGASWERLEEQTTVDGYPVPRYCIEGLRAHDVLITFPGGQTERFHLEPGIENGDGACINITPPDRILPRFVAATGTTSTLSALDANDLFFRQIDDGNGPLWQIVTSDFTPWEPTRFELVKDGLVYQIHIETGLEHITDLEGNRLEFRQDGLFHTSGAALTFQRDLQGRITAITDPGGHDTLYHYNATGQLDAVTDRNGHTTRYLYDGNNRLSDIEDPQGDIPLRLFFNEDGRLIAQEDAYGNRIVFDHAIEGREMRVTDRRGHLWVYVYDDRGNVLSATNPLGQITRTTYDARDRELFKTTNFGTPFEATVSYAYDQWDNITRYTDERGYAYQFTFDANGNPLTRTDPLGHIQSFTYDGFGRVLTKTDQRGFVTRFAYPGATILETDPLGYTLTQELDIFGNISVEIDGRGNRTEFVYDGMSRPLRETSWQTAENGTIRPVVRQWSYDGAGNELSAIDPLGNITRKEYDPYGRVTAEIDPRGNRTEHQYDAAGNKVRTIYSDGTRELWTYDVAGEVQIHTDLSGHITTYTYDALNRLVQTTYPEGSTTTTTYNAQGLPEVTTNGRGHAITETYDPAGNRIALEDEQGFVTTYSYDAAGQLTHVTNALGRTTRFEYNETGHRTATIFADGTRVNTSWDALGRPDFTEDQLGYRTWFTYLPEDELESVTDPSGAQTRYGYDEQGYQTVQIDALGRETLFGLDEVGRMTSRTLPLGQRESMGYDAAGNMVQTIDFNAQNRTYQYDARNRQTARIWHDNAEISTTYTATGKRETVTDQRGTTRYSYDLMDRLISIEYPEGDWVAYGYDEVGNRVEMQTPYGTTRYSYTPRNQIETVTDPTGGITRYAYDEVGNLVWTSYPKGVQTTTGYDALNRIVSLTTHGPAGSLLESWDYTLDATGRRIAVVGNTGRRVDYTYDSTYRLIQEQITDPIFGDRIFTHSYDAVGNRTSQIIDGATNLYDYDANDRLVTAGTTSFLYDDNGNTLSESKDGQVTIYTYDPENRLIEAATPAGVLSFTYDADGIRISRTGSRGTTEYLIDPNREYAEVVAEITDESALQVTYGNDLIARDQITHLTDAHGNTTALVDDVGALTQQYRYEAYGNRLAGQPATPYLYTGEQYDEGLALIYLRARYYNPKIGRFHTMDSWLGNAANPITLNKYLYANADPINGLDPSGNATLTGQMATNNIQAYLNRIRFAISQSWRGRYKQKLGEISQSIIEEIIEEIISEAILHGVSATLDKKGQVVFDGDQRRIIDFLVTGRNGYANVEVKYGLPKKNSEAFDRLISQVRGMVAGKQNRKPVLAFVKSLNDSELRKLRKYLGKDANSIEILKGTSEFTVFMRRFLLGLKVR